MSRHRSPVRITLAAIAAFVLAMAFPASAHVSGSVDHNWSRHYRAKADKRYYKRTLLNMSSPGSNRVHWDNLGDVPEGFLDGVDDTGDSALETHKDSDDHDERYYTETEADGLYAAAGHDHDSAYAGINHDHDADYFTKEELEDSDGDDPNLGSNRVHWDNLGGVPEDLADGDDAGQPAWLLGGNPDTTAGTDFLGTTEDEPLEIHVDSDRVARFEPDATSPSVILGHEDNAVSTSGATIGGGGQDGSPNTVTDNFGTIAGGAANQAGDNAGDSTDRPYATVGGGRGNLATGSRSTIGGGDSNTASCLQCTVGGGSTNTASGFGNSTVGGGALNSAATEWSTVGGGVSNTANALAATVGGGNANEALGQYSFVGGGRFNRVNGNYGTIAGGALSNSLDPGTRNRVTDDYGSIGGGGDNQAGDGTASTTNTTYATVGGGLSNTASGERSTVAGGRGNVASGTGAFVGGGDTSTASGTASSVGGGDDNMAAGSKSTVAGGDANTASGSQSFVGGGFLNSATATQATVAGGTNNTATNTHAAVTGGTGNDATGIATFVGGGQNNDATAFAATIGGGTGNTVTANEATVAGGGDNAAGGLWSSIPGGRSNSAAGDFSLAAGRRAQIDAAHDGSFLFADQTDADFDSAAANEFAARAGGGVRFVVGDGSFRLEPASTPNVIAGLSLNTATAGVFGATISGGGNTGGLLNRVTDDLGTVGGGQGNRAGDATGSTSDRQYATVAGGQNNTASGSVATVGGGGTNTASATLATVAGGGGNTASAQYAAVSGGQQNQATGEHSVVGGGLFNEAHGPRATVGGGNNNTAGQDAAAPEATVAGGIDNVAAVTQSTVGGGFSNEAQGLRSTVAGGDNNTAGHVAAAVGGGESNQATGQASMVPGGTLNTAGGNNSFSAGSRASVGSTHHGAFVWSDSCGNGLGTATCPELAVGDGFASTAGDEFSVRSTGGARFVTAVDTDGVPTAGVTLAAGGGSWASVSDRSVKTDVAPVDEDAVLAAVAELPISTWSYESQGPGIRHIGPMAQDFRAAFGVGEDERHITTIDADGVALAAIQGLSTVVEEQEGQIVALEERILALESSAPGQAQGTSGLLFALIGALATLALGLGTLLVRKNIGG